MENIAYLDTGVLTVKEKGFSFFKLPQFLFNHPVVKKLSCEAKVLYSVMLNRLPLSIENKWKENGVNYIYFSLKSVMEVLNCAKEKAVNVLKELKASKLILGKRDAKHRSVKYFFLDISEKAGKRAVFHEKLPEAELEKLQEQKTEQEQKKVEEVKTEESKAEVFSCPDRSENRTSTSSESEPVQVGKSNPNKTDASNTDSHQDPLLSSPTTKGRKLRRRRLTIREIKQELTDSWLGIEEENAAFFTPTDYQYVVKLISKISKALYHNKEFNIYDDSVQSDAVRFQLCCLGSEDISYAIDYLRSGSFKCYHFVKYAIAVMYNAPENSEDYWTNLAAYDLQHPEKAGAYRR